MAEDKRLYLLDAYALIYRAYYAFIRNPRITSKGFNTSAIFGFVNTLEELLRNQKPTHLAVVFDMPGGSMREKEFDYYKAHREETPEDIKAAFPWIRDIIKAYRIPILEAVGYEADDVIGTLAKTAEKEGYKVYMVTSDKDFGQLVTDNILIYKPGRQGNPSEILGVKEVTERYGIQRTEQVIDILGLMGDSVDNIPGIPGVGEKTAMKLIQDFGSIEEMYTRLDEIKGKLRDKVAENKKSAFDSKRLATIMLDAPVEFDPDSLIMEEPDKPKLSALFQALEFRGLGERVLGDSFGKLSETGQTDLFSGINPDGQIAVPAGKNLSNTPHQYQIADTPEKRAELLKALSKQSALALDTVTEEIEGYGTDLIGFSVSWKTGEAWFVPCPQNIAKAKQIIQEFKSVFANSGMTKIGHNIKVDSQVLRAYEVEMDGPLYDTMVAHYVCTSEARHNVDAMAEAYLGYKPVATEELVGKPGKKQRAMRDVLAEQLTDYACESADIILQLKAVTDKMARDVKAEKLLKEIEFPLIDVLDDMEWKGVKVDVAFLQSYSKEMSGLLADIRQQIYQLAGTEFNIDSPKQLGPILFEKLGIEYPGKKTKTGQYSTAEDVLSQLSSDNPIIAALQEYRELTKLKSTYVDALPELINPRTGRIHTTFNQTIAATGRLSSINPNLQNIPIRTDRGREIRKAFIAEGPGNVIVSADYSQIELRIIAHITQDEGMLSAFREGEDIHATTAAKVFNVALKEVTSEMRRKAKAVNFGLAYGQSAFGLAQTLGITRTEAKDIIDSYFEKFPGIKNYMTETINMTRKKGYIETLMGRRRYLRDITSKNWTVRAQAERNAINSPIQGSAADLIKIAMIKVHQALEENNLQSSMILQVHDELVFEAPRNEVDMLKPLVVDAMKNAIPDLKVPIVVDIGVGQNWLEAH
jgi:DNA polymerase-1